MNIYSIQFYIIYNMLSFSFATYEKQCLAPTCSRETWKGDHSTPGQILTSN